MLKVRFFHEIPRGTREEHLYSAVTVTDVRGPADHAEAARSLWVTDENGASSLLAIRPKTAKAVAGWKIVKDGIVGSWDLEISEDDKATEDGAE